MWQVSLFIQVLTVVIFHSFHCDGANQNMVEMSFFYLVLLTENGMKRERLREEIWTFF